MFTLLVSGLPVPLWCEYGEDSLCSFSIPQHSQENECHTLLTNKASRGTRGENPVPQYWCPSYSSLPRSGRLLWRRVPQVSCLLISVSSFIGGFTVYPECSIPIHILSIVRKTCYIQSICFSTETKHTIYPTLEIVSPNPDSSPPGSSLTLNSTCFNVQSSSHCPIHSPSTEQPALVLCALDMDVVSH